MKILPLLILCMPSDLILGKKQDTNTRKDTAYDCSPRLPLNTLYFSEIYVF